MSDAKDERSKAQHDGWQDHTEQPTWRKRGAWGSGQHLNSPSYDPELPNGFQDADFEMRELQDAAAEGDALRKRGGCPHWSMQTQVDKTELCTECGAVSSSDFMEGPANMVWTGGRS